MRTAFTPVITVASPAHLGPLCARRCLVELFAFIRMGGTRERIFLAELSPNVCAELVNIVVAQAQCSLPNDRERLLAVIEAGFGDLRPFDGVLHNTFVHLMGVDSERLDHCDEDSPRAKRTGAGYVSNGRTMRTEDMVEHSVEDQVL